MAGLQVSVNKEAERERLKLIAKGTDQAPERCEGGQEYTTPAIVRPPGATSSSASGSGSTSASSHVKTKIGKVRELQRRHSDGARRRLDMDVVEGADDDQELIPDAAEGHEPEAQPAPAAAQPAAAGMQAASGAGEADAFSWTACSTRR